MVFDMEIPTKSGEASKRFSNPTDKEVEEYRPPLVVTDEPLPMPEEVNEFWKVMAKTKSKMLARCPVLNIQKCGSNKDSLGSCISVYNHAFAFPELVTIPATKRGNGGGGG
ncbi:hypothetical protein LXL04_006500 [Taraxacum kok-saghyz]